MKTSALVFNVVLFLTSMAGMAAEQDSIEDALVEINGTKKYMLGHLMTAQLDAGDNKDNKFIFTDVFRYEGSSYRQVGTVLDMEDTALQEISDNNYVYTPVYSMKKVHGQYREHGAIIVGTKDKKHAESIVFAALHALADSHKS